MLAELKGRWNGIVCFAGQPIDAKLQQHMEAAGLERRIHSVIKPDHRTLTALYSGCQAFVFPSFSEGFGWPLIEAQACGVPVIASAIEPMPEVSGGAALHADPHDAKAFAEAFLSLENADTRMRLIAEGHHNVTRFSLSHIARQYVQLYQRN